MYQWNVTNSSYRVHVEAPGYESANSGVVSVPPPITDLNVGLVLNAAPTPALKIRKEANLTSYADGQTIKYVYTVKNTGNVNLAGNITVNDNITGAFNITSSSLNAGDSIQGTATYPTTHVDFIAGSVTNLANATALFNNQPVRSPDTTLTVPAMQQGLPALTIVKSASPTTYSTVGQTITYTYTITNSGNVDIKGLINIIDSLINGPI